MRDFSCFCLSASGEKGTSSRFSQLDQESCRRHILAWSRGMHLTYSAVTPEVKFIAEGMVWVAEKVDVWHTDNFPVHMRMQSCLETMTEQVCTLCCLCASLIWWGMHRALPVLHRVFSRSQGQQPECSAGAAQVTEWFHLTVGFEGSVRKCYDSSIQTVETKAGMEGWGYFGKVLLWSSKSLDNKAYRQKHWININWRLYVSLQSTNPCLVFAHCMPSAVWEHPWTES